MATKQRGKCPFCLNVVAAVVEEPGTFRRDKCWCPSCHEVIYVCRSLGCHDYAKGTESWDHELCYECTKKLSGLAATVSKYALDTGKTIAVDFLKNKTTKAKDIKPKTTNRSEME